MSSHDDAPESRWCTHCGRLSQVKVDAVHWHACHACLLHHGTAPVADDQGHSFPRLRCGPVG